MKAWKIVVLLPYAVFALWMAHLIFALPKIGTLGGIIITAVFAGIGLYALMLYTIILVLALLARWLILRRRKHSI